MDRTLTATEVKAQFFALLDDVQQGEEIIITRHGKPVAQIAPPPPEHRTPRLGLMKGRIRLLPGWDDPID